VRGLRFVHGSSPKDKNITAEGSTLVYLLFLHNTYDGRFIIDHLKEIFEEVVETMPPGAPPSPTVAKELDRIESEILQVARLRIMEELDTAITLQIDRSSIGNNLHAARHLEVSALDPLVEAIISLAEDADVKSHLSRELKTITMRHVHNREGNRCVLKDGTLLIETFLGSNGSNALSRSDIYNSLRECVEGRRDERRSTEPLETGRPYESGSAEFLTQLRQQALEPLINAINQMSATTLTLEGDWDAFERHLASKPQEAQMCLYTGPQTFAAALMQLLMMNPPFAQKFRQSVKIIRFGCTQAAETPDILLNGDVLICRLQPEMGMGGSVAQAVTAAKLQALLPP
jgi:hypothetical protein